MSDIEIVRMDVEKLIASKNPKLLKWLPRFIVSYLKKILHETDVNYFLERSKGKKNQAFCAEVVDVFDLDVTIDNMERIPASGPVTIVMNHPLGGMDAIAFVHALANYRTDIKFIVNDLLLNLEGMKEMFVGVNKHGSNSLNSKKKVADLFETDELICVFPAGLVSRKKRGIISDLEWKKTFITMSRKRGDRVIVPVHINGRLSNFFYNLANFRSFLGIKVNIEMFFLINELYKQKGRKVPFIVGNPIQISAFDKSKSDVKWAEWMKEKVYTLEK
jgi:putative hemolysin